MSKIDDVVSIGVKVPETTSIIYLEVLFTYSKDGVTLGTPGSKIDQNTNIKFNGATQTLRDMVTLNLTNDVSSENSIPVSSKEDFINMSSGTADSILQYALTENLTLNDYEPRNLENISFDGNGYTITINNFKTTTETGEHISKYGLFNTISSSSIVKNLTINYSGLSSDGTTLDTSNFGLSEMYFGGVAVTNDGIIYNTKTTSSNKLNFVGNINIQTYIAGVACENNGFISYSASKMDMEANCGFVAGFVAVNSKKISNSKVLLVDATETTAGTKISNTLTNSDMSLTGGFVARNRGEIFGCYISGGTVSSRSTLGGFANQNTGKIDSCYSNVEIESTLRASGFVYQNDGAIASSYSSSTMEENNSALTTFIGRDASANFLNSGTIDDCYFVSNNSDVTDISAKRLSESDAKNNKTNFAKFVFADDNNDDNNINGTWKIENDKYPQLVDADIEIVCQRSYTDVQTQIDGQGNPYSVYSWQFEEKNPAYGKVKNNKYNPRTITSISEWDEVLEAMSKNSDDNTDYTDYVVLLCDLSAERDSAPKTSKYTFKGKLFGNNMSITNLYLRAESTNTNKCYGLFEKIRHEINCSSSRSKCIKMCWNFGWIYSWFKNFKHKHRRNKC